MHLAFVSGVFDELVDDGLVSPDDHILSVCGGSNERDLFAGLGFTDVIISNLDENPNNADTAPFEWSRQDAQALSYDDNSFDWAVVVDGLHHCASPHRGLVELYRVARRGVIAVEARDSALMRLAIRSGLTGEHEIEAVVVHQGLAGGLNNTAIPNYVYRWTEAEFEKTIRSFDPTGEHTFRYRYGLHLPWEAADLRRSRSKHMVLLVAGPVLRAVTRVWKKECNSIAMVAVKPTELWPWLRTDGNEITFDTDYGRERFEL